MKAKMLLRFASACIIFFAAGHTMGHITRKKSTEPQVQEVFKQMETVHVPIGGQSRSYDEFYNGMSINLIITLVAFAFILWFISNASIHAPRTSYILLWPILFCIVGFAITGFVYFFLVPAITCVVASILILMAINSLHKQK
ncbi:MAG TPA: hypothetical protein VL443_03510 [Cyclobacteriaceae bacterium]|nr:hypothetical protein [Cyclobacteriaceae bacterium]